MRIKKQKKNIDTPVSLVDSNSIVSEQFKMIRTNIEFSFVDADITTIVVTSINPDAGKSTVSANLAKSFASEERKVLLVDADMRKPTVHKVFNLNNQIGLSSFFSRQGSTLKDAIQETFIENLFVLSSGKIPPNPSEILSSNKMLSLIEELKQNFDLIIFDTPPMAAVADAHIMSARADGTIFVLRRGVDNKESIKKCKDLMSSSNAKVLGAVFNREEDSDNYYYYG